MTVPVSGIMFGYWEIILLLLIAVFAVIVLRALGSPRRRNHRERQRQDRHASRLAAPAVNRDDVPRVNLLHLVVAVLFAPFVLFYWAVANIGDLLLCSINGFFGLFELVRVPVNAMVGGSPSHAWVAAKDRLARMWVSMRRAGLHLLTCFGLGGIVEHIRADISAGSEVLEPPPDHWPFEDRYRIESQLGSGGSTARLFIVRRVDGGRPAGDQVVLKYFDLRRGSHLEEVIRESRGMQTAKEMGIVLDHQLERDHFYYVMPYYEGETLTRASARLHRQLAPEDGLSEQDSKLCLEWMAELLRILDGYHRHGVIHKDVKPDNVIVTDRGIRLVDLGLLTPLTSAMTLTTHGTEYFRDPEMVKLAIQGQRVKDVHAARFDIYSTGAVLYLLFEGSFPACGPLSSYSKPVPMAISWITSRAMAEGGKRYPSVAAMRADLDALSAAAGDGGLHAVAANRLPSFGGFKDAAAPPPIPVLDDVAAQAAVGGPLRRRKRGPLLGLLVILLAVLAIVVGARLLLEEDVARSHSDPKPEVQVAPEPQATLKEQIQDAWEDWTVRLRAKHAETAHAVRDLGDFPVYVAADESFWGRAVAGRVARVIRDYGVTTHRLPEEVVGVVQPGHFPTQKEKSDWVKAAGGPDRAFVIFVRGHEKEIDSDRRRASLTFHYRDKLGFVRLVSYPETLFGITGPPKREEGG